MVPQGAARYALALLVIVCFLPAMQRVRLGRIFIDAASTGGGRSVANLVFAKCY